MIFTKILSKLKFLNSAARCAALILVAICAINAQQLDSLERGRAKDMLNAVKNRIKDKYYDPNFKGINLDDRFKAAELKLKEATTLGQAYGIIAQVVLELNDSHTRFYPPTRTGKLEYGWRMQMLGDKCLVTSVRPGSDAEKQGLKTGDEILSIEGFRPNRKEMNKIQYYYNVISPRTKLNIKVQSPGAGESRELSITTRFKPLKARLTIEDLIREFEIGDAGEEHRFITVGNTSIWKMPSFAFDPAMVDGIMTGRIKKSSNLIFDLRGNPGGYVVTLEKLSGYFVEKDTKIADLKGRKEMKPQMAKTEKENVYKGRVIVLVDANSGSAAEIFARFMQIEQRGVVIGDQSAGAVMQSRGESFEIGDDRFSQIVYGMNMTNADVIMTDGKSIEHVGVTPQLVMFLSGADLAAGRDPVLAAALQLFDEKTTPEQAGKFFPYKWENF